MSNQPEGFPKYQSKQGVNIKFQKYITLRQLFWDATKTQIQQHFSNNYAQKFGKFIFVFKLKYHLREWNIRKTFPQLQTFQHILSKKYQKIPKLPLTRDQEKKLQPTILKVLQQFLRCFIRSVYQNALNDTVVISFFDIFPQKLGQGIIYGEFTMFKRSGGRYNENSCLKQFYHCAFPCSKNWRQRFFTVTDTGIFYTKKSQSFQIKEMLLYCFKFNIYYGFFKTGRDFGIVIESSTRRLKLQSEKLQTLILFIVAVQEAILNSSFSPIKKVKYEKYGSFAPIRYHCTSKLYVDGKDYFQDMYNQLKKAKKFVYIAGWMITPFFMLKRPNQLQNRQFRLDGVLEQLAKRNVKIYIIVYQQPKLAINNDSEFVEFYLQGLGHNNIKVIRHPNYLLIPFLWSHHEKIVVVDQKVAFLGGLDLCYGRWDNCQHQLKSKTQKGLWQGADFCNLRIRDIYKPREYQTSNLTSSQPRMPWHDVAIQIKGPSVHDLTRHFTSYWNFVNFQTKIDNDRQLLHLAGLKHPNVKNSRLVAAKNFFKNINFLKKQGKVEPMIQMSANPVMPQRQNNISMPLSRRKVSIQQQFYEKYMEDRESKQSNLQFLKDKILKYPIKILSKITQVNEQDTNLFVTGENQLDQSGRHKHLLLRSSSTWSAGLSQTEFSIHTAYIDLIQQAKHFIYIQNQFFIARQNLIIEALAQRILKAHGSKQQFKVVVFIPLLPGFQGDVRQSNSTVMRIQLHHQYQTIYRSNNSLYSKLLKGGIKRQEIEDYIRFFSLRQHGVIEQRPVTQILYIHSKMMIIDDQKLIIGSANINDRSMLGDRDSEIAILIEDDLSQVDNKQQTNEQHFCKEIKHFRCKLFIQHFAFNKQEAEYFYSVQNWREMKYIAQRNTQIYRYIFGCYPDDKMKKFSDIGAIELETQAERKSRYEEESKCIKGHAVELPLHFLEQQNLKIQISQKEIILPEFFFT